MEKENRIPHFSVQIFAILKLMLAYAALWRILKGSISESVILLSCLAFFGITERLVRRDLPSRVLCALSNRLALVPVLIAMCGVAIQNNAHFPLLLAFVTLFIFGKELFFVRHAIQYFFRNEEYAAPRGMQKINAVAVFVAVLLYAVSLRWAVEPYHNLALIAVLVISFIDGMGLFWNRYRKKRSVKEINLATKITLMRLLMSPVFLIVYFYDRNASFSDNSLTLQILAIILAIFFTVTDGLDGYFARKRNEVTKLGKYLDPFSDKICTMTMFLCFVASNYVPVWMVALVFYRETAVDVIRTLAAAENVVISARSSGKWKTALQATVIITVLVLATTLSIITNSTFPSLYPAMYANLLIIWNWVPFSLMGVVTLVTVLSGIDYVLASREILDKYFR
ncbi:MAG: CDP-diacylglycerol--glycerol-3-phosphate 3-phosphatidyltransferase [Fibrobacteres bacterium]|nr:CDP-diacylglycerol--glycerol-3-phosphate 3-phosphatidyltransferase [Fibrobacterota bacterium]